MSKQLLKLQIGPVQDFIAQARSTRDLWSGSYLLSWLMAAGAKALVAAAGANKAAVISPTLEGQPIYDFQCDRSVLGATHSNDAILTPNFTNILVAELPEKVASAATRAMEEAIRAERDNIAQACWQKLKKAGLVTDEEAGRFFAQIQGFPTITWQLTPAPPGTTAATLLAGVPLADSLRSKVESAAASGDFFPAQITRNSWELDAVRALREFRGWSPGAGGHEKDSLTGREEAVVGGKRWWTDHFEWRDESPHGKRQRLLRLKDRNGQRWESELWPVLFRERQQDDWFGALQLIKRLWHWAYLAESPWNLRSTQKREPLGKEFPFPSTPQIAIHDPAKNIREYLTEQFAAALEDEIEERQAHSPYFAVLAMDGDHMGAWLGGENNPDGPTKQFRSDLSARLSNFALHCVRPIVEACDGRLIYAGGEDVLALLPADTAVECARFLRAAYRGESGFIPQIQDLAARLRQHHLDNGYEEPPDRDEKKPEMSAFLVAAQRGTLFAAVAGKTGTLGFDPSLTAADSGKRRELRLPGGILADALGQLPAGAAIPDVSAGLAIAHFKEPLQDVVQAALAAEKRAKNDLGRAALAVTLVKHSGETVKWGCRWESGGLELLDLIQRGRGQDVLSSRFAHRLIEVLSPYLLSHEPGAPARLEEVAGFQAQVDDLIARELVLVLARQSDAKRLATFVKQHAPEAHLKDFLTKLAPQSAQEKLRAVIGLCQTAAFIEPALYSLHFTKQPVTPAPR